MVIKMIIAPVIVIVIMILMLITMTMSILIMTIKSKRLLPEIRKMIIISRTTITETTALT